MKNYIGAYAFLGAVALWSAPALADSTSTSATDTFSATPAAQVSNVPARAGEQHLAAGQHFTIDPVFDGVFIAGGAAFSGLLGLILSTGEIQPTTPGPTSNLLSIDRGTVTQHIDPHAGLYSNLTLGGAVAFAVLDPFLSAYRDGWDAGLTDAIMYAESIAVTEAFTDITKIGVRRPRPIDYLNCSGKPVGSPGCTSTDLQLSFFSGHSSTVAAIGATATYLAFVRAGPHSPRPWITLAASVLASSFVSYERVRSGQHFPTDVIAGTGAGAMIGILVPHLHRNREEAPHILLGYTEVPGGGALNVSGIF